MSIADDRGETQAGKKLGVVLVLRIGPADPFPAQHDAPGGKPQERFARPEKAGEEVDNAVCAQDIHAGLDHLSQRQLGFVRQGIARVQVEPLR